MTADGQQLARSLRHVAEARTRTGVTTTREQLVALAVASLRHRMTRRQRLALAARLAYVAVTGRAPR